MFIAGEQVWDGREFSPALGYTSAWTANDCRFAVAAMVA